MGLGPLQSVCQAGPGLLVVKWLVLCAIAQMLHVCHNMPYMPTLGFGGSMQAYMAYMECLGLDSFWFISQIPTQHRSLTVRGLPFEARFFRYLPLRGLADTSASRVWWGGQDALNLVGVALSAFAWVKDMGRPGSEVAQTSSGFKF